MRVQLIRCPGVRLHFLNRSTWTIIRDFAGISPSGPRMAAQIFRELLLPVPLQPPVSIYLLPYWVSTTPPAFQHADLMVPGLIGRLIVHGISILAELNDMSPFASAIKHASLPDCESWQHNSPIVLGLGSYEFLLWASKLFYLCL